MKDSGPFLSLLGKLCNMGKVDCLPAMRRKGYGAVLVASLAFTGCATAPTVPKVIQVPTNIYVPIPPELDADCAMPTLTDRTVNGAIDFAIRAKGALIECSDRMAGIRAIQGSAVK